MEPWIERQYKLGRAAMIVGALAVAAGVQLGWFTTDGDTVPLQDVTSVAEAAAITFAPIVVATLAVRGQRWPLSLAAGVALIPGAAAVWALTLALPGRTSSTLIEAHGAGAWVTLGGAVVLLGGALWAREAFDQD